MKNFNSRTKCAFEHLFLFRVDVLCNVEALLKCSIPNSTNFQKFGAKYSKNKFKTLSAAKTKRVSTAATALHCVQFKYVYISIQLIKAAYTQSDSKKRHSLVRSVSCYSYSYSYAWAQYLCSHRMRMTFQNGIGMNVLGVLLPNCAVDGTFRAWLIEKLLSLLLYALVVLSLFLCVCTVRASAHIDIPFVSIDANAKQQLLYVLFVFAYRQSTQRDYNGR